MPINKTVTILIAGFVATAATGNKLDPDPQSSERPNVLFMVVDDLNLWVGPSRDHPLGHPQARTPNLDRLASEGVYFERAYCQVALCGPSRSSFMTGLRPTTTGYYLFTPKAKDDTSPFDSEDGLPGLRGRIPIEKHFREHGYTTMVAGKVYHGGHDWLAESFDVIGPLGGYGPFLAGEKQFHPEAGGPLLDVGPYPERNDQTPDHNVAT